MAQYSVEFNMSSFAVVRVEAETEDEAVDLAYDQLPTLCSQCSGWDMNWSREDGEPEAWSIMVGDSGEWDSI